MPVDAWTLSAVEGVDPFVAASAHEAMARAYAVGGDVESAVAERNAAYALAVDLEDDDDRGVIESDLGSLPAPVAESRPWRHTAAPV